jgi:RNA polymerase sigma-70 factor (ECF subfamily)
MTHAFVDRPSGVPRTFGQRGGGSYVASPDEAERLASSLRRHFTLVWRSLRRFGIEEAAVDDAAQHVFLVLAERLPEVEVGRERAFLIALCVRVAANARRRRERCRETASDALDEHPVRDPDPETLLESKQRRQVLDLALDALLADQRTVFVLFELEGLSLPEIADLLEIPLGTATSRLRRARRRFESWITARQQSGEVP